MPDSGGEGEQTCALMEELAPPMVSFHFGLPAPELLDRLKSRGILILAAARLNLPTIRHP